jgi:hypothetical protein
VQWTFDNIDNESGELHHLAAFLADKKIDMVINLPMRGNGARRSVLILHTFHKNFTHNLFS